MKIQSSWDYRGMYDEAETPVLRTIMSTLYESGWRWIVWTENGFNSKIVDNQIKVDISWSVEFTYLGQKKTKEEWNEALESVVKSLADKMSVRVEDIKEGRIR